MGRLMLLLLFILNLQAQSGDLVRRIEVEEPAGLEHREDEVVR